MSKFLSRKIIICCKRTFYKASVIFDENGKMKRDISHKLARDNYNKHINRNNPNSKSNKIKIIKKLTTSRRIITKWSQLFVPCEPLGDRVAVIGNLQL